MPPRERDTYGIDFATLRVFVVAGGERSMQRAALSLGISQPAVSQAIQRLEQGLGVRLIDRTVRPFKLTAAGDVLMLRGEALLSELERLKVEVQDAGDALASSLRVGLMDSFATTVGPLLVRNLRNYADRISLWSGVSPGLGDDLLRRNLDLIVASDPMYGLGGLDRSALLEEPFVLALPASLRETDGADLQSLVHGLAFVRYSVRSFMGQQIEQYLRRIGFSVLPKLEFNSTEPVYSMVAAGLGWAITTPLCLAQAGFHRNAGVRIAPLPGEQLKREVYVLTREGEFAELAQRVAVFSREALRQLVVDEFAPTMPWLSSQMIVGTREIP
ncbi:MAG: LysR family transcriptional regulator [Kiloniellaceae bacterium]